MVLKTEMPTMEISMETTMVTTIQVISMVPKTVITMTDKPMETEMVT